MKDSLKIVVVLTVGVVLFLAFAGFLRHHRKIHQANVQAAAFEDGRAAAGAGVNAEANPYGDWGFEGTLRRSWLDGWVAARSESRLVNHDR